MRKMKKNKDSNRLVCRVLGIMLVLCMLMADVGAQLIFAGSRTPLKEDLMPDSMIIDTPKALSEISLPKCSYGTLAWKDGSIVPSTYSSSYEVLFKAGSDGDFSQISGWDAASRTISGKVTVYVKSLAPAQDEEAKEEEGTASDEAEKAEDVKDEQQEESMLPTEEDEDSKEDSSETAEDTEDVIEQVEEETSSRTDSSTEAPATETKDTAVTEDSGDISQTIVEESTKAEEDPVKEGTLVEELPKPSPASPMELVKEEARPVQVSEEMSLEEQAVVAAANHTCQGITVSADFLPWYVQFRVSDGSGYGFTNSEDAATFQAYEFQLWDLLNDKEYQIPDGKSVQVTMPVPTGYTYSIQHILPDGTREAITPTVYGGMLVFTTSSFSPFGIAGSRPLVGEKIANEGYGDGKQSSSVTPSVSGSTPSATVVAPRTVSGGSVSGNGSASSSQSGTGTAVSARFEAASSGSSSVVNSQNTTTVRPVKTGDPTQILPYVILALGALLVIVALVLFLKRKNKQNRSKKSK